MMLNQRYEVENIRNLAAEMVYEAVEKVLDEREDVCHCQECVLDLTAYMLNHITPRYRTSLLNPLQSDSLLERRTAIEIELALASGLKKIKEHPHHG